MLGVEKEEASICQPVVSAAWSRICREAVASDLGLMAFLCVLFCWVCPLLHTSVYVCVAKV